MCMHACTGPLIAACCRTSCSSAAAGLGSEARAVAPGLADQLAHAEAGQLALGRAPALALALPAAPAASHQGIAVSAWRWSRPVHLLMMPMRLLNIASPHILGRVRPASPLSLLPRRTFGNV